MFVLDGSHFLFERKRLMRRPSLVSVSLAEIWRSQFLCPVGSCLRLFFSSRMFGPLVYLSCLGPERLLRQQAQADAAPLPLQLRLLLR